MFFITSRITFDFRSMYIIGAILFLLRKNYLLKCNYNLFGPSIYIYDHVMFVFIIIYEKYENIANQHLDGKGYPLFIIS